MTKKLNFFAITYRHQIIGRTDFTLRQQQLDNSLTSYQIGMYFFVMKPPAIEPMNGKKINGAAAIQSVIL